MASKYSQLRINMESGREHQTMISLPSYEMYQAELLDRLLLSIQHTEEAFIDVNNRIITNVNARKDRLNMVNARIQSISARILSLYGQKRLMRITSPAVLPKISTSDVPSNHPHQTVFFDREEIIDLAEEIDSGAQPTPVTSNMPELFQLKLQNKLYNTRLKNDRDDLQMIISGATKHIHDITRLLLSLSKYRADTMGAVNAAMRGFTRQDPRATRGEGAPQPSDASQEGVLGARPSQVTSVAELMLFDTNTNVYEDNKVNYIQETAAVFNIRGRQKKVLSKKEKQRIEQQAQLQLRRRKIEKAEELKKAQLAAQPASFQQSNLNKPKYLHNEFHYIGAAGGEVDINLADDVKFGESDDEDVEGMDTFFARNKAAAEKKKLEMTTALANAREDHEMTMMNPNQSRLDRTVQQEAPAEVTPAADATATPALDDGAVDPAAGGEEDPELAAADADQTAPVDSTQATLPEVPEHDPNSLEDLAPAERLRINQAIVKRELEERQRLIEEMIAAEKERDPDALDEDIRTMVNKMVSQRRAGDTLNETTMTTPGSKKSKAPAIALGTVMAANLQQEIGAQDENWKNQAFVSKQKTVRVGGPPKGPPPTGGRPGAPPRGPPPTGGRRATAKPGPAAAGAAPRSQTQAARLFGSAPECLPAPL